MNVDLVLFILAAVCFGIATVGVAIGRISLLALGLFFWVLTNLV